MTIENVKKSINMPVKFTNPKLNMKDSEYVLTACIIRRGQQGFFYQAELQDIKQNNSILICGLEEIEAIRSLEE